MPAQLIPKDEVLSRLMDVFRDQGFEGATLADLSQATGLGKSSLYHYFPEGKEEMAAQVLAHLDQQLAGALGPLLASRQSARVKLEAMLEVLDRFYAGGKRACLLERLCASASRPSIKRPLRSSFSRWIGHFAAVAREAGVTQAEADRRAEDALAAIEGALIVCAGTGQTAPFSRALAHIRHSLLSAHG